MSDPVISDAMIEAYRNGYWNHDCVGGQECCDRHGLRAAITQWLAEQPVQQDRASVPHPVVQAGMDVAQPAIPERLGRLSEDWTAAEKRAFLAGVESTGVHVYLSTGCYHGRHDYCAAMVGMQGEKRPARCKWCEARCVCNCHSCPTCSGPVRETVGMICQTCGTDYATPASVDGEPDARPGYAELRAFWDYWHKQCGHFDVPGEGHGLVTGIDAKDAWELDRLGDAVEAALARPATPAEAGAPEAPSKDQKRIEGDR